MRSHVPERTMPGTTQSTSKCRSNLAGVKRGPRAASSPRRWPSRTPRPCTNASKLRPASAGRTSFATSASAASMPWR